MPRIAVVIDDLKRFKRIHYFLHPLIEEWERSGWEVLLRTGIRQLPEAEVAILHVDLTRLPEYFQDLSRRYPAVLNLQAVDISKRRISRQLVGPDDGYTGPVIVKTDANSGGVGERAARYGTPVIGRLRRLVDRRRHWTRTGIMKSSHYPVYPFMREVPPAVWANPHLVVERFIGERHGENYALRQWVFLGDREISRISFSANPVVKAKNIITSEALDSVPDSLRILREELGFDYGKFDYVLHEGMAVLLDANRTPTAHPRALGNKALNYAAQLADGIRRYLP